MMTEFGTITPVILCGGGGTRLWPASRAAFPKQFNRFAGQASLLQTTLSRAAALQLGAPMLLTAHDFRFIAAEQSAELGIAATLVVEPTPRDTAPAIAAAALMAEAHGLPYLLVMPSDHRLGAVEFAPALAEGLMAAAAGRIVTFGVRPSRAETGYGYIEPADAARPHSASPVRRFIEKPDAAQAAALFADGRYLWNAGIFLFAPKVMVAAFATHAPDILAAAKHALDGCTTDLDFLRLGDGYAAALAISIDYAVMERAGNVDVVPIDAGWSDLGDWKAIWDNATSDANGVVTMGGALAIGCEASLLSTEPGGATLVGLGLKNIVAVATGDAVLVADMAQSQAVKSVVNLLKSRGDATATTFKRHYRPWGWFEQLAMGPGFQVKTISVKPGGKLSLQSHKHRSEHWVVVNGVAQVTVDAQVQAIAVNQSIYVPLGARHRLENNSETPLLLVEVQVGSYLGEDDIIRYDDVYARN